MMVDWRLIRWNPRGLFESPLGVSPMVAKVALPMGRSLGAKVTVGIGLPPNWLGQSGIDRFGVAVVEGAVILGPLSVLA